VSRFRIVTASGQRLVIRWPAGHTKPRGPREQSEKLLRILRITCVEVEEKAFEEKIGALYEVNVLRTARIEPRHIESITFLEEGAL
jgi:hypothetical protein